MSATFFLAPDFDNRLNKLPRFVFLGLSCLGSTLLGFNYIFPFDLQVLDFDYLLIEIYNLNIEQMKH